MLHFYAGYSKRKKSHHLCFFSIRRLQHKTKVHGYSRHLGSMYLTPRSSGIYRCHAPVPAPVSVHYASLGAVTCPQRWDVVFQPVTVPQLVAGALL